MLPDTVDIRSSWNNSSSEDQHFIRSLSLFFTSWLKEHSMVLEQNPALQPMLMEALKYLVRMSTVEDKEIFKICLEYWGSLAATLYHEMQPFGRGFAGGLMLGGPVATRRELYAPILSQVGGPVTAAVAGGHELVLNLPCCPLFFSATTLAMHQVRLILITNMAKPEEVLIVVEDNEPRREVMKDTDTIELYKSMRVALGEFEFSWIVTLSGFLSFVASFLIPFPSSSLPHPLALPTRLP